MDKNIAALLRNDARTIRVVFEQAHADFDVFEQAHADFDVIDTPPAPPAPRGYKSGPGPKAYTYVTHLPANVGDLVVVPARGNLTVAVVSEIDDEVRVEPNSDTQYQWVHSVLDRAAAAANAERNAKIERTVSEAYRNNLRRSFAQQILAGVDDAHRGELTALLGAA